MKYASNVIVNTIELCQLFIKFSHESVSHANYSFLHDVRPKESQQATHLNPTYNLIFVFLSSITFIQDFSGIKMILLFCANLSTRCCVGDLG